MTDTASKHRLDPTSPSRCAGPSLSAPGGGEGQGEVGRAKEQHAPAPAVSVVLPGALVALFPGSVTRLQLRAATVAEMIGRLDERWPGMRDRLCDSTPAIRRHLNIFVNGRRATLETAIPGGAEVFVLTAMSGG